VVHKKNHLAQAGSKRVNLCTLLKIKNPTSWEKGKAVIKTSGKDNKPELICKISNICGTYHRPQCPYRTRNMPWILQFETIWDKTGSSNCTNQHNLNHQPNSLKGEYFTYQSGHRI